MLRLLGVASHVEVTVLLIPGCLSLVIFAYLLTRVDSAAAGRSYAAYGGIYITFAVLWLWGAKVSGLTAGIWLARHSAF